MYVAFFILIDTCTPLTHSSARMCTSLGQNHTTAANHKYSVTGDQGDPELAGNEMWEILA